MVKMRSNNSMRTGLNTFVKQHVYHYKLYKERANRHNLNQGDSMDE